MKRQILLAPALLLALLPGLAASGAAQVRRAEEIRYPALRSFDVPKPERVVLDNGLVVMLLEDRELPLIEATALVRTGTRLDPADKVGLAEIAAEVLRSGGTQRMPGDQLDDLLEGRAAIVEVWATGELTEATLSSLRSDFPEVLRVFADVLRRPAFDESKLEVARTRAVAAVSRQNDEPSEIMNREFDRIVYGADSPYGRSKSFATLAAIRREDLVAWHAEHFHPDRMVLGIVGDFDREEVLRQVREAFGGWPRGPAWKPAEVPYRKQPSPGVFYVEKSDMTQSYVIMGHLGLLRNDPDYYALEVLNQIFSGGFSSRLFTSVRTRKGLAYAVAGGVWSEWDHPGQAALFLTTKTETTGAGIEALLEEARNLRAQPPTDEDVEKARQALLNSFVFQSDSPRKVLRQQLTYEVYGYPLDWLSRYQEGIRAVTTEQVRRAARHLRPEEFSILVIGPAEGRDKPLTAYGPVTRLDLSPPPAAPKDASR
jgi:zinc protease